ncbi:hypothetical protein ACFLRZ_05175 [Bacteroidota bacterium]
MKNNTNDRIFSGIITMLIFIFLIAFTGSLFSQEPEKSKEPEVKIKVTKEYDKDGNLIGYDSSYSKSYLSFSKNIFIDMDSLFEKHGFTFFDFDTHFNHDLFCEEFPFHFDLDEYMMDFDMDVFIDSPFDEDDFWFNSPFADSLLWKKYFNSEKFNYDDLLKEFEEMFENNDEMIPEEEKETEEETEKESHGSSQQMVKPEKSKVKVKVYKI